MRSGHPATPPRLLMLAGPTASGKSDAALCLAQKLGGEIISVDSMQVYRGLDIGTAKPSSEDRRRVAHHLIDVVDLTEPFDAAQFVRLARAAVADIQSRGRLPILCGGTGLYFKAFVDGLGEAPPADAKLRAELESTPLPMLLLELEQRDPEAFATIDRQNRRRVVRALEVVRLTGRPFSQQRAAWKAPAEPRGAESPVFLGLARESRDLEARVNARVDAMFRNGLVEETRQLLERGLVVNRTAMQAIGYRQVVEHLRGERSLAETRELVKVRTRQFAKRQMTWFRKHADIEWVQLGAEEGAEAAAERCARGASQFL